MASVVNKTIQASGGDYATAVLWEADTDNNIVAADEQHNGKLAAELFTPTINTLRLTGATTDSTRYRHLTIQSTRYDPTDDTGPRFTATGVSDGATLVYLDEPYAQASGFGAHLTLDDCYGWAYNTDSAANSNTLIDGCYGKITRTVGTDSVTNESVFRGRGGATIRNSKAETGGASSDTEGFLVETATLDNNTAYNIRGNGFVSWSGTNVCRNNVGIDCAQAGGSGDGDFRAYTAWGTIEYCVSSDSTATGTGSQTGKTAAACFTDAGGSDYSPVASGPLDSTGTDLSGTFTTDYWGTTRSNWSVGAIDDPPDSGVTVEPDPAEATAGGVDPTVILGPITVAPDPAAATAAGVDPTTVLGPITVAPDPAAAATSGVDPTVVLGAIPVGPAEASSGGVDPTVILGPVTVAPDPAAATASGVDPSVAIGVGGVEVAPDAAAATASGVDPTVILGSITVAPGPAAATASAVGPSMPTEDHIVVAGEWSDPADFEAGDEWFVTCGLPGLDAPELTATIRFEMPL